MKRYSAELKAQVLSGVKEVGNVAAVARKHGISIGAVHGWMKKEKVTSTRESKAQAKLEKVNKLEKELARQKLENEVLRELLKKNEPCLAWRLIVAENFIFQGHSISVILEICGIARSSWYHHKNPLPKEVRRGKRGRPVPGYTKNPDGTLVTDISIMKAIRDIRSDINFANGGGYQKLKHYLRRDFGYHVFIWPPSTCVS